MAQVHIAADLSAQYFSVNVKPTACLPSPLRSISSLLSKHSTTTTLWLSVQCSLYRLSLLFAKSRFKFRIFLVPSYLRPLLNTFVLPGSLKEAGHITCFIWEKPRGHWQLGWASWQALEVATKIFREIFIIKHNSRQRPVPKERP